MMSLAFGIMKMCQPLDILLYCLYGGGLYVHRAVRYDDIYRMDEIKSLSFHIMFYRLFCGVAKYIVYGTFSSFGWLRSLHATTGVKGRQKQVENDQN